MIQGVIFMNKIADRDIIILPVTYPVITSYPVYASYFSMLCHYPQAEAWIYTNVTNLWAHFPEDMTPQFKFSSWRIPHYCPFIDYSVVRSTMYPVLKDFPIGYIEQSLACGYYLLASYDEYYIPYTSNYQKCHTRHQIFIYGYDRKEELFYIGEFFQGKKFEYLTVSYKDMSDAITSGIDIEDVTAIKGSYFIPFRYVDATYEFDCKLFVKNMEDYLQARHTVLPYENNLLNEFEQEAIRNGEIKFGIAYYDELVRLIDMTLGDFFQSDTRPFQVFYEHKVLMAKRIRYLEQQQIIKEAGSVLDEFVEIQEMALMVRNLYLKLTVREDAKYGNRLRNLIYEIKEKEVEGVRNLITILEHGRIDISGNKILQS